MKRTVMATLLVWIAAIGGAESQVPKRFPPERLINVQVMPKDATVPTVIATMKGFTEALGVRCPFCHVGEEGMGLEVFDFASDVKPQKAATRDMMKLTAEINARMATMLPGKSSPAPRVTCVTCHRGSVSP